MAWHPPIPPQEIELIREAYAKKAPNLDILSAALHRRKSTICRVAHRLGLTDTKRRKRTILRSEASPNWKANLATTESKRIRARKLYSLGPCVKCGKSATDRHHIDGNTGNNHRSNIRILCRRCHMQEDGRLSRLSQRMSSLKGTIRTPASPCSHCGVPYKGLCNGMCAACAVYLWRTGIMRPAALIKRTSKRSKTRGLLVASDASSE